jgi:glycosyltransferase involved in cell wall biosynthesis
VGVVADGTRPALLVSPHDPVALSGALRSWLDDPDLRRRLRATARERRDSLPSWTDTAADVSRVLVKASR